MRAVLALLVTIFITSVPAVAAEAPFVPPGVTPPDYVAIIVEKWTSAKDSKWTVMHHGDWSRARPDPDRDAHTEYLATNGSFSMIASSTSILLLPTLNDDQVRDDKPRDTGERQAHLGETCAVWEIGSSRSAKVGMAALTRLSCITDDGIELWQKRTYGNGAYSREATRIERRPVSVDDSAPPPRLALNWWDKYAPPSVASDIPDIEVIMALPAQDHRSATAIRTYRRSGQWQRIDETLGARRLVEIRHQASPFRFVFSTDKYGRTTELQIAAPDKPDDLSAVARSTVGVQPKSLDRKETVLGESCDWFDLTPDVTDKSTAACLARDRIVLKQRDSSKGMEMREWTAVSVKRRPVTPDEMKPPAELLDPQTWLR
jgi:hypothetical protein